ncbi:flagellar protein FliT [Pullulanibacillus pueri]|uniref:Flagellar protein FliT n=1 Tax=Pullulanibacillus pueri TaxID=1437324 RepID=A0A8J3A3U2_9BACL|nr:hypothetical protein [Pullulanibacillus pueri]MBM7684159.1 flagellar protein FliT [Pullulanibacillus pueri]GGH88866.1 hypothetical protein GCM10007096_42170 [Pullulanibacillus pueri]
MVLEQDITVDEILKTLYDKSKALVQLLQSYEKRKEDRSAFIEEIQTLLDEREVFIKRLQAFDRVAFNEHDELKKQLLELEPEITGQLQRVFHDIQRGRRLIKAKQQTRQRYQNPYANMHQDGAFLDKRK